MYHVALKIAIYFLQKRRCFEACCDSFSRMQRNHGNDAPKLISFPTLRGLGNGGDTDDNESFTHHSNERCRGLSYQKPQKKADGAF